VNTTALQTGDNCYSDTDDTGGEQKMVYVSQFCFACDTTDSANHNIYYWIGQIGDKFRKGDNSGDYTFSSSDIHPAFNVDSVNKVGVYISAYEGYVNTNFMGAGITALESKAGVPPTVSTSLPNFRTYAEAIGTGWELSTIQITGALQALFIVECATLNGNTIVYGNIGNTALIATGGSTSGGNATYGSLSKYVTAMSYRGVENLWGNVSKAIEGINIAITTSEIWIAPQTRQHTYSCASPAGYTFPYVDTGLATPYSSWSYITAVATVAYPWAFIPSAVGGSASTYLVNEVRINTGYNTILLYGGAWSNYASLFQYDGYASTCGTATNAAAGARLCYLPA
jgi:hypothetical protein